MVGAPLDDDTIPSEVLATKSVGRGHAEVVVHKHTDEWWDALGRLTDRARIAGRPIRLGTYHRTNSH